MNFEPFQAVLFDLDGTIWHEHVALPGAAELVQAVHARGKAYGFVSNSGLASFQVQAQLAKIGIKAETFQILTAADAACDYVLHTFGGGATVFNVANDSVEAILAGRVRFVDDDPSHCDVVMAGGLADRHLEPPRLHWAMRHLMSGAKLIGLCADRAYPTPRGFEIGAGGVCQMLAYAANVTPTYCGKPEAWFFLDICKRLSVDPWNCVLIGDNLESDIAGGKRVGMSTILTLTGIATRTCGDNAPSDRRADWVVDDLTQLIGALSD